MADELSPQLEALEEAFNAFEAGLAVDAAEARRQLSEAMAHVLPSCALLQHRRRADVAHEHGPLPSGGAEAEMAAAAEATEASDALSAPPIAPSDRYVTAVTTVEGRAATISPAPTPWLAPSASGGASTDDLVAAAEAAATEGLSRDDAPAPTVPPPGHTAFSWEGGAGDGVPAGHTSFSWGVLR